jgi:hypothetical protein
MEKPDKEDLAAVYDWIAEEGKERLGAWLVLEAMVATFPDKGDISKVFGDDSGSMDGSKLILQMSVNGIPVPVQKVLDSLHEQFESLVESKAKELVKDRFQDSFEVLDAFREDLLDKLSDDHWMKDSED